MTIRMSLRDMVMLIRVDNLRQNPESGILVFSKDGSNYDQTDWINKLISIYYGHKGQIVHFPRMCSNEWFNLSGHLA